MKEKMINKKKGKVEERSMEGITEGRSAWRKELEEISGTGVKRGRGGGKKHDQNRWRERIKVLPIRDRK